MLISDAKPVCPSLLTWECDNDECIHFAQRCDGKKDCSDGSDESVRECISFQCQPTSFRCAYGACVNKTAECNGAKDCADNSDELTAKCIPDIEERRRGNCTKDQFHCSSGECIALDGLCDGSHDCKDKSDETVDNCAANCCPPFGFRCGYGACVDERSKCDGIEDCADGSDENQLLCGRQRKPDTKGPNDIVPSGTSSSTSSKPTVAPQPAGAQTPNASTVYCFSYPGKTIRAYSISNITFLIDFCFPLLVDLSEKCEISKVPNNGWIEFVATSASQATVGNVVNSFTPVKYQCQPGHVLSGKQSNICFNGEWMYAVPDCVAATAKSGSH